MLADTEIQSITNLIWEQLDQGLTDCSNRRILMCGTWLDIAPVLDFMAANRPAREFMSRLIVATNEVDPFINEYFGHEPLQIVDWNESAYEEQLIERIDGGRQGYEIMLVLDFQPTPRRLRRIRRLMGANGTLVIPKERPSWRCRYPDLMKSFSNQNGTFIKLMETLPSVNRSIQMDACLHEQGTTRNPTHQFSTQENAGSIVRGGR